MTGGCRDRQARTVIAPAGEHAGRRTRAPGDDLKGFLDAPGYEEPGTGGAGTYCLPEQHERRRPAVVYGELRRRPQTRERGREGRCLGGRPAHPHHAGALDGDRGGRRRRHPCSAAGGRSGRKTDGGDDSGDPATIPCTGGPGATRRSWWWSPIRFGSSQSTARCASMEARVRPSGGEEGGREQASKWGEGKTGQHGVVVAFNHEGGQGASGAAQPRRHGAAVPPTVVTVRREMTF